MRAIYLEVTKSQTAEEFQKEVERIHRKENKTSSHHHHGGAFKATAEWIKKLRKSESLLDFLARQENKTPNSILWAQNAFTLDDIE